ncbi:hypothetical protein CO180_01670 [candidate division WWE3 bacterium CG_4_9_14_3_um_filter_41_6]|nr:MAG: hypothetical protein CO180_01670 [candidate division WWE3 bacterium CG_4_9_14_3_um_filter_41_6]
MLLSEDAVSTSLQEPVPVSSKKPKRSFGGTDASEFLAATTVEDEEECPDKTKIKMQKRASQRCFDCGLFIYYSELRIRNLPRPKTQDNRYLSSVKTNH